MDYRVLTGILEKMSDKKGTDLEIDDYLKILKDKEIKKFLDNEFKNITSLPESELNRRNPILRELLEIYFMENNIEIIEPTEENSPLTAIGLYLNDIRSYKLLSKNDEIELFSRIKNGDEEAKTIVAEANLRLVVSIAKRYSRVNDEIFMDAIGDGNEGLLKAIEKFDLEKECKFSTYATWWITQGIKRGQANNSRTIRIPVHSYDKITKIRRIKMQYFYKFGEEPTNEYVAKQLDMPLDRYLEFINVTQDVVSGDATVNYEEEETTLFDFVPDSSKKADVEGSVMLKCLRHDLENNLATLTDKESNVLKLRFGFDDDNPRTLEEVGQIYGVTRERVRQIEAKALKKLRHRSRSKTIQDYL